jgi:tetratricopeptide (TPR) repeat protein
MVATLTIWGPSAGTQSCWAQQTDEVQQHFLAARKDQDAGAYSIAITEYRTVLRLNPSLPEAHVNLGLLYFACNRYEESEHELRIADKLRPNMAGVSLWLGVDRLKQNDPKIALIYLERAIRLNPNDREAQRWLEIALWENGETESALDRLQENADKFPGDPENLFVLGEAYQRVSSEEIGKIMTSTFRESPLADEIYGDIYRDQQDWQKAIAHYSIALTKDPRGKGAHLGLGTVYLSQNLLDNAETEFHEEIGIDRSSAASYSGLMTIALERSDVTGAQRICEDAILIVPASALLDTDGRIIPPINRGSSDDQRQANLLKAQAILEGFSPGTCVALLQVGVESQLGETIPASQSTSIRQLESNIPAPVTLYDRAFQYFARNDLKNAQQTLRRLLRNRPEDFQARYLLARVYHASCLAILSQLLLNFQNSYRAHQLQAEIYEDTGENNKALKEYEIVEQMDDKLPGLHGAIGRLYWKDAKTEEAMGEFTKELQLNPDDLLTNAEMGTILMDREEADRAIPYLRKALKSGSEVEVVHKQLGFAYFQQKDYVRAEAEMKKAIVHDPYGSANYMLGRIYKAEGRADLANTQFAIARAIIETRRPQEGDTSPKEASPQ